jgi:hypothetical protein
MSYILKIGNQNFTAVSASGTTHNTLNNIQGGTVNEFYHLTSASYVNVNNGTSSYALSASYAPASSTLSGTNNYIPKWSSNNLTSTSSIYDGLTTYTSSNVLAGTNWNVAISSLDSNNYYKAVCYSFDSGTFVAVGGLGTGNSFQSVMTSPDGITWTQRTSSQATTNTWNAITYASGTYVAVGGKFFNDEFNSLMTSPDGITWTQRTSSYASSYFSCVTYGSGTFVAGNIYEDPTTSSIMTSPNGITWTPRITPFGKIRAMTYGSGTFVAVCGAGVLNTGATTILQSILTSPNGITWTPRSSSMGVNQWNGITYGSGTFVAVGAGIPGVNTGSIMTSPDGITWTSRTSPLTTVNNWKSIAFVSGTFVAIGNGSLTSSIMTSPDGITWTLQKSINSDANTNNWNGIAYNNDKFVVVGAGSSNLTSVMYSSITSSMTTSSMDVVKINKAVYVNNDITFNNLSSSLPPKTLVKSFDGTYLPVVVNGVTKYIPLYA